MCHVLRRLVYGTEFMQFATVERFRRQYVVSWFCKACGRLLFDLKDQPKEDVSRS